MLCVRCQHPLPAGADRCLRCFALNPQNRDRGQLRLPLQPEDPAAVPTDALPADALPADALRADALPADHAEPGDSGGFLLDEEPPQRLGAELSIASDPPPAPLRASFESDPPPPLAAFELDDEDRPGALREPDVDVSAQPTEPPPALAAFELDDASPPDAGWRIDSNPPPHAAPLSDETFARAAGSPLEPSEPPFAVAPRSDSSEPPFAADPHAVPSQPPFPSADPSPLPERLVTPSLLPRAEPPWAPFTARLLSWAVDLGVLAALWALHVAVAVWVVGPAKLAPPGFGSFDYWLDLVAFGPRLQLLWAGLLASLAVAYSWLFASVGGRTPGMAAAGLRLRRTSGVSLSPLEALGRALVAVPSAALGCLGFALCLFDPRGQTLHDKVSGTAVVRDLAQE